MNEGDRDPSPSASHPPVEVAVDLEADPSRRGFLQGSLLSVGAGTLAAIGAPALAHAQTAVPRTSFNLFAWPPTTRLCTGATSARA
jgi:hypothetical protein